MENSNPLNSFSNEDDRTSFVNEFQNINQGPSTYLCIGNEQSGQLEVDLIQFREKNISMRYLSFTFSGINPKTGQIQSAFINIDNEEAFLTIKNFFKQLDWNS